MAKLELLVDSYSSPSSREKDADLIPRTKGELFEPLDAAERDRLIELGAALDPKEAAKQREAELDEERQRLEARKAEIEAEIKATKPAKS